MKNQKYNKSLTSFIVVSIDCENNMYIINIDVTQEVFKYLSHGDLMKMRLVSKSINRLATIEHQKRVNLITVKYYHSIEQFEFYERMYKNVQELHVFTTKFIKAIQHLSDMYPDIRRLYIRSDGTVTYALFPAIWKFKRLAELKINMEDYSCEMIQCMLRDLPNVKKLTLDTRVIGDPRSNWFNENRNKTKWYRRVKKEKKFITKNIEEIEFIDCDDEMVADYLMFLKPTKLSLNINDLYMLNYYTPFSITDYNIIVETIEKGRFEPNIFLKNLTLDVNEKGMYIPNEILCNFLKLFPNLESLQLRLHHSIDESLENVICSMRLLKRLTIHCNEIDYNNIANIYMLPLRTLELCANEYKCIDKYNELLQLKPNTFMNVKNL